MKIPSISTLLAICLIGVLLAGCAPQQNGSGPTAVAAAFQRVSPLVGTWTGESKASTGNGLSGLAVAIAGDQIAGHSTLTLQANGLGYLKIAKSPERQITWKQDGKKVILDHVADAAAKSDDAKADNEIVATLDQDEKHMTLDLGQLTVSLDKTSPTP